MLCECVIEHYNFGYNRCNDIKRSRLILDEDPIDSSEVGLDSSYFRKRIGLGLDLAGRERESGSMPEILLVLLSLNTITGVSTLALRAT